MKKKEGEWWYPTLLLLHFTLSHCFSCLPRSPFFQWLTPQPDQEDLWWKEVYFIFLSVTFLNFISPFFPFLSWPKTFPKLFTLRSPLFWLFFSTYLSSLCLLLSLHWSDLWYAFTHGFNWVWITCLGSLWICNLCMKRQGVTVWKGIQQPALRT